MSHQIAFDMPGMAGGQVSNSTGIFERIGKIAWSYSRRGTLEHCPRRYYYAYYGSSGPTGADGPQKEEIRFLRGLQNRYQRTGQILHLVISTFLRRAQAGEVWSPDRLCIWSQDMFKKDCEQSQRSPDRNGKEASGFGPTLLQEFHYRLPDAQTLCALARDRLVTAVEKFAVHPLYSEIRQAGSTPGALIERPIKVAGLPCRVGGRLDLAYRTRDGAAVVDWKLGGSQGGDDSLQLATYGLWASTHFGVGPDSIQIYKAHLANGELTSASVSDRVLSRARTRIIQDAEQMATLDDYGRAGVVEAFTPCAQPAVCALCPFKKICAEGRACLNAGD